MSSTLKRHASIGALLLAAAVAIAVPDQLAHSDGLPQADAAQTNAETVLVDPHAPSRPFPHYWERMFGSGRAILTLRESYRRDLRQVKQATGFEYVRFHAIFHDEVGLYDEDADGRAAATTFPTSTRSTMDFWRMASARSSN